MSLCKDEDDDWHVIVTAEDGISKDDHNRLSFYNYIILTPILLLVF